MMNPQLPQHSPVVQSLAAGLLFLHDLGFAAPTVRGEASRLWGQTSVLTFTGINTKCNVEVGFAPASESRPITLSVFLCKQTGERFSLEDWVRQRLPASSLSFSLQDANDEVFFIRQFCKDCEDVLCGPLRPTLLGEAWDAVAFDWKGYR